MAKTSGHKAAGTGSCGGNYVNQALAAVRKGAAKLRSRESQGSVAAEEHTDARHASDEDDETQRMVEDDNSHLCGASSTTQQGRRRDSDAETPPTQDKSAARSLSGAMKEVANGANNVDRLEHDRVKVAEY